MLNLSNLEKISKILGMRPEDITRYDIKAGTKKYKSNTDEGWELILALRELDNGKTEKLNQKAEENEELLIKLRKEEEEYKKIKKHERKENLNQCIRITRGIANSCSICPDPKIKFAGALVNSIANVGDAIINKDKDMASEDDIKLIIDTGRELYNKAETEINKLKRK